MTFLKPIILGICNPIYTTRTLAKKQKTKNKNCIYTFFYLKLN